MDYESINALDSATGYILLAIECCSDIDILQDLHSYLDMCMDEIRRIENCQRETEQ